MSLDNSLADSISTFPVSPSDDQLITLTYGQLQDLIIEAVEKAIQPLQDEVSDLRGMIAHQEEKIAALEATQDTQADNQLIQLRLINQLREVATKEPGKTEMARAEKIEKYLVSRPDHRAAYETLKGLLGVDKHRLHEAVKILMNASPGRFAITKTPGDKRRRTLIMLPK